MKYTKRFNPNLVTEQTLLDELLKLSQKLGRTPSRNDMLNKGTNITKRLYLYDRKFGGLSSACEKIELVANKGSSDLKYTDEELLNYILELNKLLNRVPTQEDITNANKYSIGAYKRHFGTYNKVLEKLELDHNLKFNISTKKIKNDIIRVASEIGRSPKCEEFSKMSKTVSWVIAAEKLGCNHSWNSVLKKCGLQIGFNKNLTEQDLKNEIERLKNKLNRIPGYYDMIQLGDYSPETYAKRFGSYLLALKYFGYIYTPSSQWQNQTYANGKDGTLYKSKFETNIANCLFDMKVDNKITSYQYEKQVCQDRKWTCDFYVIVDNKEYWLEADGMGDNRFIPYNMDNEKIEYYKQHNYKYIIIPYKKTSTMDYLHKALNISMENCISNKSDCPDNEIIKYNGNLLTAKFLKNVSLAEKEKMIEPILEYFSNRDFSKNIILGQDIDKDWIKLKYKNIDIKNNCIGIAPNTGHHIYKYFFPNILKVSNSGNNSVLDVLNDKKLLLDIIKNRLGIGYKEIFNITTSMIKQGAKSTGLAAHGSQFKPLIAKAIYNKYIKDGDNILDYSCGFGSRLLGLMATGKKVKYFGYEPNTETYDNLLNMSKYFDFKIDIKKCGSEEGIFEDKMNFIFSSPPYFNHEIYCSEITQCYNKYPNYNDWLEKYWRQTVKNIHYMMAECGIFGINIGNNSNKKMINIAKDITNIIQQEGFRLKDSIIMQTQASHLSNKKNKGVKIKEEFIFFYTK